MERRGPGPCVVVVADLARELVSFMLGPTWQAELPLTNFVLPAVRGTPLPSEFQQWAAVPESPRSIDPEVIDEQRDGWVEQWRNLME